MMHQIIGMLLGFAFLLGSCRSTTDDPNHAAVEQKTPQTPAVNTMSAMGKAVLATHDSAMADVSELMRLKKAVKQQVASIASQTPSAEVTKQQEQGMAISQALEKADQAMMDWMHGYNGDTLSKLDQQQAKQYLKDQQEKASTMRQLMLESIRSAKTYLQ